MVRHYEPTAADRRLAVAVCVVAVGALALDARLAHGGAMLADTGGGGIVGAIAAIGSALAGLFGRGKVDSGTKFSLVLLRTSVLGIAEQLTNYATETTGRQSKGAGILLRLWDSVLLPFITKADSRIRKIYSWLKDTFGPVVDALLWLRKHVIDFYTKWFKPILDTIDAVRGILRIMGLLHIEIAKKLDAKLAALEQRLLAPLRVALTTINTLINWTERVIDGDGFFQRYTILRSQVRYAVESWNALLHPQLSGVDKFDVAAARAQLYPEVDAATISRELTDYYTFGGGELAADVNANAALWLASASQREQA